MEPYNIGDRLRQKRLALGRSLDDVVHLTRIPLRYLEAIEENDLSPFPGIVFTRSFVRQYALSLDLDPEPLLEALPKLDQSTVPLPQPPDRPRARRTRLGNQNWTSAAVALAAALCATGAYLYHDQGWRITLERRAPAEQNTVKAQSLPPSAETPAPRVRASQPASADPLQVVITAHERAWIGVKVDDSSHYAYIGTLTPNEVRAVSATEQIRIATGNAGGITVSFNGKTLDPLGRHGQPRTLRLTAAGPELLSPDGRSPDPPAAPAAAPADPL